MSTNDIRRSLSHWVTIIDRHTGVVRIEADPHDPVDEQAAANLAVRIVGAGRPELPQAGAPPTEVTDVPAGPYAARPARAAPPDAAAVLESWNTVKGRTMAPKTHQEYVRIFKRLVAWLDEQKIPLLDLDSTHLALFQTDCVAQIGAKTWNKYAAALSSVLRQAAKLGAIRGGVNPAHGLMYSKRDLGRSSEPRRVLGPGEIETLFAPATYLELARPHEFWVPLLCLYQALRANEASQLKLQDFDFEVDPPTLVVRDKDADQRVKTRESQRLLPVHPTLLALGLRAYLDDVHAARGDGRIFPYLRHDPLNGYADVPSEAFSRYRRRVLKEPEGVTLHALRKTANNRLRQKGVAEETRSQFLGHRHESINSAVYTDPDSPGRLAQTVLPNLDFVIEVEALHYKPGRFSGILQSEMRRRANLEKHKKQAKARRQGPRGGKAASDAT